MRLTKEEAFDKIATLCPQAKEVSCVSDAVLWSKMLEIARIISKCNEKE
jgi:hypothetical protein